MRAEEIRSTGASQGRADAVLSFVDCWRLMRGSLPRHGRTRARWRMTERLQAELPPFASSSIGRRFAVAWPKRTLHGGSGCHYEYNSYINIVHKRVVIIIEDTLL
jgi:hypothetical protein